MATLKRGCLMDCHADASDSEDVMRCNQREKLIDTT
jgi:hypothetical protein